MWINSKHLIISNIHWDHSFLIQNTIINFLEQKKIKQKYDIPKNYLRAQSSYLDLPDLSQFTERRRMPSVFGKKGKPCKFQNEIRRNLGRVWGEFGGVLLTNSNISQRLLKITQFWGFKESRTLNMKKKCPKICYLIHI